jgi:NAD(P)-dependent dehydrogenase (short-subunit alcohol dehydrogenase family)
MADQQETIVWITGATSGIGEALARTCPWPDTEIISVSRRDHPTLETVRFDLTDMGSWDRVGEKVAERLATFRGKRAIFIHNALYYWGGRAFVGEGDPDNHRTEIIANVVSPLVIGDLFLRAAAPAVDAGVDVGLVQISSASARIAYPGLSIYGAAKAAMEQWVRGVRAEREHRGKGPWVVAIRPGFVDTPASRREAELPPDTHPGVPGIAEAVRTGNMLAADESARLIWGALPEQAKAKPVLLFGEPVGVTT